MSSKNVCQGCIEENSNDCCVDVYIILNPDEIHLFKKYKTGFKELKDGGIFYTTKGCPYFNNKKSCTIHKRKPHYCKYYPIFITGKPFIHDECSIHNSYKLTDSIKKEIFDLQQIYSIYKQDWFWEDVVRELQIDSGFSNIKQ